MIEIFFLTSFEGSFLLSCFPAPEKASGRVSRTLVWERRVGMLQERGPPG